MDPDEDAENIFSALSESDREVLARFYLEGENAAQICAEMDLSMERFLTVKRLAKRLAGTRRARPSSRRRRVDMNADDRAILVVLNILPEGSRAMLERFCGEGQNPSQMALTADQFETVRLRIRPHLRWIIPMCRCGCGGRPYPYTRAGRKATVDCIKFGWRRL
jgi:hypothetical protein